MFSNYSESVADRTNPVDRVHIDPGFRDFLENRVRFKEAVTINDPQVLGYIHLSYKLQYLKDTAMARFIDDTTSHTIIQLITTMHQ